MEHLFICLFVTWVIFLDEVSVHCWVVFSLLSFKSSLCVDNRTLSDVSFANVVSLSVYVF